MCELKIQQKCVKSYRFFHLYLVDFYTTQLVFEFIIKLEFVTIFNIFAL